MDNGQRGQQRPFDNAQGQRQIQIKANENVLRGLYSTHMQAAHTREEFVLDFMNIFPPQAMLVSRVIVSPAHLKRMVNALTDNLKKYEEKFGTIQEAEGVNKEIGFKVQE